MRDSRLGYQKWLLAMYLLTEAKKGISSVDLSEKLGVTQKTAWYLAHRLRTTWKLDGSLFSETVEADETYVGGSDKWRHLNKRKQRQKTPVIGLKERESGKVRTGIMYDVDRRTMHSWLAGKVSDMAALFTDQASCYVGADVALHCSVNHSKKQYVDGDVHTNGIESYWTGLKRSYHGVYHWWSDKHLHRYLSELEGRFNSRDLKTLDRLAVVADGMCGEHLPYASLTA